MSDSNKKPDFKAYNSVTSNGGKTYYYEVGTAWKVAKGGISIDLHSTPVGGQFVLFPPKETPPNAE